MIIQPIVIENDRDTLLGDQLLIKVNTWVGDDKVITLCIGGDLKTGFEIIEDEWNVIIELVGKKLALLKKDNL